MTYTKHNADAELCDVFWRCIRPDAAPEWWRANGGGLHMERLESHPSDWRDVVSVALPAVWDWSTRPHLPVEPEEYAAYVYSRAFHAVGESVACRVTRLFDRVYEDVTPVRACHGDMTLGNVMLRANGDMVFIDPGYHRGLPCRELDEAKLLQSALGWDEVRYGRRPDREACRLLKRAADPVHWALLAGHLVRLLHHDHPHEAKQWAMKELRRIV